MGQPAFVEAGAVEADRAEVSRSPLFPQTTPAAGPTRVPHYAAAARRPVQRACGCGCGDTYENSGASGGAGEVEPVNSPLEAEADQAAREMVGAAPSDRPVAPAPPPEKPSATAPAGPSAEAAADSFEREADATAARVVSGASASPPHAPLVGSGVQRKCAECEEEEETEHEEPTAEQEKRAVTSGATLRLQRHADGGTAPAEASDVSHVRDVTASPGQPLDRATRSFFEPRFGRDFSGVRVHTDARASASARAIHARAYTAGQSIAFRAGEFAPSTTRGRTLLAHELTHVAQQAGDVIQRAPDETSTRSTVAGGGATPGRGAGLDLMFLVLSAKFVPDIKKYVDANLAHESSYEISSLDKLFEILKLNSEAGQKVRRIRIVSHGLATGEVRLQNPTNAKKPFVTPKDVAEYAKKPHIRAIVDAAMAPGAVVEFWGCSIGRSEAAGEAWATLFGTTFKAQTETFQTGFTHFLRPAKKGETGQTDPRKPGKWVMARHRSEIDNSDPSVRLDFLRWLLAAYEDLARNGDIDPLPPTGSYEGDITKRLEYMTDIFNRAKGDLRNIEITKKGAKKYAPVRPGDGEAWQSLWRTFTPRTIETITEHPDVAPDVPELPSPIPDIPTDIPVWEPSEAQLQDLGLRVSEADLSTSREPAVQAPTREPVIDPLVMCRLADTNPSGSLFARVPFATDSDVIPARENDLLSFATTLGAHLQTTRVRIDGYASTDGSAQYNLGLACRRALNVSEALTRIGMPPENIASYAHDETSEFSPGDHAANRIVLVSATPAGPGLTGTGPASERERATSHLGPHLLLTGADAARWVANVMPRVSPIVVTTWLGDVKMEPGTIWDANKMLVLATPMTTYYVIDDRLYEMSTGLFLRTFWIGAFAKGVKRAEWLVPLAKIEMALLTGLLVPWQILLAVTIVDTALTYYAHRDAFNRAFRIAWDTAGLLLDVRQRYPHYFEHLLGLMVKRLGKEVASDFLRGVSAEDVAFFLGRLLKGIGGLTELTVRSLIGVTASTAALVTVTHAPAIAVHGVKATVESQIAALQEAMRAEGVTMTQGEARVLLREFQAHPDTEQRLLVLQATLSELVPALQGLSKTLAKGK